MVAATTSSPASTSKAAATDESTPPDMATRTRSFTAPPRPIADWRLRIADLTSHPPIRNPQSAIRNRFGSPVQHGGQRSHLLDNLGERCDRRLHVLRRVLLAEREPQRRDAQLSGHAHGREYVRRLDRAGRAGGARGAGDPREIEVHQQCLAVGAADRHAGDVRCPPSVRGVDHGVGHDGEQPALELVAQRDRKSTRLNSSHSQISYAVFCLKKKKDTYASTHSTL